MEDEPDRGIKLYLLGPFHVARDGVEVAMSGAKMRALVSYLAIAAPESQPRERLVALLWGDRLDDQARQSLRHMLSKLRKIMGPDALVSEGDDISLAEGVVECDVTRFEALLQDGSAEALRKATALYRGTFLDGLSLREDAFEAWIAQERQRLQDMAVAAFTSLADKRLEAGRAGEALELARRAVELDAYFETAHRCVMRALAALGQRGSSLEHYHRLERMLEEELSARPDAETSRLRDRIEAGDGAQPQSPREAIVSGKPSIVVLPFTNLSQDPEQEYFADGVVEDLITALSRFPWLFVIARNSSFAYKGRPVQARQVSQELGVRYLVEGSVRSSPTRLRVTAQLIDTTSGHHVWAEKYDRPTGDFFDLQDEICQAIIGVLVPALSSAERERSLRSNRPGLDAWEAYQKGLAYYYRPYSDANHAKARRMFDCAIELDESFADAYVMIALMGIYALTSGQSSYTGTTEEILAEAAQAAKLAVQLEDKNALTHTVLGRIYDLQFDGEAGVAECETAIGLNPNLAIAHHELGILLNGVGRYADAVSHFDQAIRLSPNDPSRWNFCLLRGFSMYAIGEFETSIKDAKDAARMRSTAFWPLLLLAASSAALGRMDEARAAIEETLARKPDCTVAFVQNLHRGHPPDYNERFLSDLRKAGLQA